MLKVFLLFVLFSNVWSESVRETETWMPMQPAQTADVTHDAVSASGDAPISDFGFDEDDEDDEDYDHYDDEDEEEDEEMSGSGDGVPTVTIKTDNTQTSAKPNINENKIPEMEGTIRPRPTSNEIDLVQNENEFPQRKQPPQEDHPSNVLMSHASEDQSFINKTEVLAGVIVGGAVTLLFAVLLILLLIYRMKKKDEGSYDLGRKPIYKKAPTTEIYA